MASSEADGTDSRPDPRTEPVEACPLCGEERSEILWTLPDRLYGVPGEYRYVRCTGCRSVYQSPRVVDEDLHLCYPGGYYTHSREAAETGGVTETVEAAGVSKTSEITETAEPGLRSAKDQVRGWIRWAVQGGDPPGAVGRLLGRILALSRSLRERAFFGLIDEVIPGQPNPGRALEIGSGSGWELRLLDRMGWKAEGVEFDPAAAERASREYGVSVRVGDFTEVIDPDERYDLIYLSHVFEHLSEPRDGFAFFGRHLSRGGRAVLVFPNRHGLGARHWGGHWQAWDPPRHLVLPSVDGIRLLADRSRLRARVHTRARGAAHVHAASRAIAGRSSEPSGEDSLSPRVRIRDRLFALLEAVLMVVGLPAGEETVVVLEVAD